MKITQLREEAYQETMGMLRQYGKCVLIRPTGFGKTGILTRVIRDFERVVYVYPAEIIREAVLLFYYGDAEKIPKERTIGNVTFLSYSMLANIANNPKKYEDMIGMLSKNDIIIFDECHHLGADGASKGVKKILESNPDIYLLGATATPERTDMIDEIAMFFDDRTVSEYNLHDAFRDDVLQRPYYFFCNYKKIEKEKEKELAKAQRELSCSKPLVSDEQYQKIRQSLIEISNIHFMPDAIKRICHGYASLENYMRFICFFSSYITLEKNGENVRKWFHEAYPDYSIRIIRVTAQSDETLKNAKMLKNIKKRERCIDLIFSCEMMNLGYHVNDLTGVIMYRGTKSGIVYTQQLGRILSSGNKTPGICIDIVDNIHSQAMYKLLGRPTSEYRWRQGRLRTLLRSKAMYEAADFVIKNPDATAGQIQEMYQNLTPEDIEKIISNPDGYEWSKEDEKELKKISKTTKLERKRPSVNMLAEEDLIVIEHQATYRDLIRKTVAEAKSMRARQAWARWLEQGGIDKAEDGRPLGRAEILAQTPPSQIPLPPFCYSKHVSVEAVLDEMGVPKD